MARKKRPEDYPPSKAYRQLYDKQYRFERNRFIARLRRTVDTGTVMR
jgi:hypothetical protein